MIKKLSRKQRKQLLKKYLFINDMWKEINTLTNNTWEEIENINKKYRKIARKHKVNKLEIDTSGEIVIGITVNKFFIFGIDIEEETDKS